MKCEEARKMIYDYAADELTEEDKRTVAAHIESCPECHAEYEACAELLKAMNSLDEEPAPESLLPNVMGRISAEKRRVRFNSVVRFASAAAAAVVLVVGAVNVLPMLEKEQPPVDTETQSLDAGQAIGTEQPRTVETEQNNDAAADDEIIMKRAIDGIETEDESVTVEDDAAAAKAEEPHEQNTKAKNKSSEARTSESISESSVEDAGEDIMPFSLFPDESDNDFGHSGADSGAGASGRQLVTPIFTAGVAADDDAVVETEERSFICRRCEFTVAEEYAEAALSVSTANKSMSQISAELDALGVRYEIYVIEDEYTQEYKIASPQRKAEIEALCASDQCTIKVN